MKRNEPILAGLMAVAFVAAGHAPQAAAHPHVWIGAASEVLYDATGAVSGFRHAWTFDEGYASLATQGLDANGDGKFDRDELLSLAQENVDSLKEFGYFTEAKIEGEKIELTDPIDYYAEYDPTAGLSLHFTLPLKAPVNPGTLNLTVAVYDPSYFIAFAFTGKDAVKVAANAPKGCGAALAAPPETQDQQALDEAFFSSEGGAVGALYSQDAIVTCK